MISRSMFGLALVGAWLGNIPISSAAPRPQLDTGVAQPQVWLAQDATPDPAPDPAPEAAVGDLPTTKTVTIVVEGEPQAVVMQLYQYPEVPLVTYYPSTLTVDQACSADGCAVSFTNPVTEASIVFMFPAGAEQATDLVPYITGPEGLVTQNEWVVTGTYTDQLNFPWAQQLVTFQTPELAAVGLVYLGAVNNQGFAVMALFPPDAGDGFMPEANAIFSEIQVQPRR